MIKPEIIDLSELKNILIQKKTALICTKYWIENNLLEKYLSINSSLFFQIIIIPSGEPESNILDEIRRKLDSNVEEIVGLGGGSTIDSAKMLSILKNNNFKCADYEYDKKISSNNVTQIIAIPTTSGSGSEATMYTVINNSDTHRKFTLTDYSLLPKKVILIPELTLSLSDRITIATGMDAFVQAFEAFFSKRQNMISSYLAPHVMAIILKNLPSLIKSPSNLHLRKIIQEASFLSGICINYSRTGLIHTISVSLSKYFSNLHGELNTIIMPHVIEFNQKYYTVNDTHLENLLKLTNVNSLDEFLNNCISFCRSFNLRLYTKMDVDKISITQRIFEDSGLFIVNPRKLNENQALKLVENIVK